MPKQKRVCKKHKDQKLQLYCITCQTPICSDGTVKDHQDHDYDLLTEVVDTHATKLVRHADDVEELQRTLEHHIARLKQLEDVELPGTVMAQTSQISSHFTTLINALRERDAELTREVEETCARKGNMLAEQRETLANAVASMSSGIEHARRTAQLADSGDVFEVMQSYKHIVGGLCAFKDNYYQVLFDDPTHVHINTS